MYTDAKLTLVYNTIFCLRRFLLVLINISLSSHFPFLNLSRNHFLLKILLFLLIQSLYGLYIWDVFPHTQNLFNYLEVSNELLLVLLAYLSMTFTGLEPVASGQKGTAAILA